MYVKEITIDGFKSYAQRVVVPEFDPQFNAITGLNGSGKSNILDSICFVLGITNLQQVRAEGPVAQIFCTGRRHFLVVLVDMPSSPGNRRDVGRERGPTACGPVPCGGGRGSLGGGSTLRDSPHPTPSHSTPSLQRPPRSTPSTHSPP